MIVKVRAEPLWKLFLRVLADLLLVLGAAGVVAWIWGVADGALYQYSQGVQFESAVEPQPGASLQPISEPAAVVPEHPRQGKLARLIAPGLPKSDPLLLGRLEVPSVHLNVLVREGVDEASLRKAAGHLPASALPGDRGNVVLLGHRDTFFRPLRGIAQGDSIRVKTRNGSFDYVVDSIQVVAPEQSLAWPEDPAAKSMTLITCFPFNYVGPAPRRFIVRARMAGSGLDLLVHADTAGTNPLEKQQ